jgi:hypothetical protein
MTNEMTSVTNEIPNQKIRVPVRYGTDWDLERGWGPYSLCLKEKGNFQMLTYMTKEQNNPSSEPPVPPKVEM